MTKRVIVYVALVLVIGASAALVFAPESGLDRVAVRGPGTTGKVEGRITTRAVTAGADESRSVSLPRRETRSAAAEAPSGVVTAEEQTKQTQTEATRVVVASAGGDVKVFTLDDKGASAIAAVAVTSPVLVKGEVSAGTSEPIASLASNVTPAAIRSSKPQAARDLGWLRRQNPSHYVIQVLGVRDASAVHQFFDTHKLGAKGAWYVASHENKPWYVVVYGVYPDRASARAAIKSLPGALRAGSPWPRSVASVIESAR